MRVWRRNKEAHIQRVKKVTKFWVHTYPTVPSRPKGSCVQSLVQIGSEMWICIWYKQTHKIKFSFMYKIVKLYVLILYTDHYHHHHNATLPMITCIKNIRRVQNTQGYAKQYPFNKKDYFKKRIVQWMSHLKDFMKYKKVDQKIRHSNSPHQDSTHIIAGNYWIKGQHTTRTQTNHSWIKIVQTENKNRHTIIF
jgi:hypothetical protein